MYADHSGELMPIMSCGADSRHRPPHSSATSRFISFQRCSESSRTPSRSKITASGTQPGLVAALALLGRLGVFPAARPVDLVGDRARLGRVGLRAGVGEDLIGAALDRLVGIGPRRALPARRERRHGLAL